MIAWLKGKKSHIVAGLMVLVGVVNMVAGDMSIVEFITSPDVSIVLNGFGLSTLRAGIAKRSD